MSEKFNALIEAFAKHVGLPDDSGFTETLTMSVDDVAVGIQYVFDSSEESIVLYCDLGPIPEQKERDIYRNLLEGNYFWTGTGGATLSINSDTGHALAAHAMPLEELDGEGLAVAIDAFADVGEFWTRFITSSELDTDTGVGPSAGGIRA